MNATTMVLFLIGMDVVSDVVKISALEFVVKKVDGSAPVTLGVVKVVVKVVGPMLASFGVLSASVAVCNEVTDSSVDEVISALTSVTVSISLSIEVVVPDSNDGRVTIEDCDVAVDRSVLISVIVSVVKSLIVDGVVEPDS